MAAAAIGLRDDYDAGALRRRRDDRRTVRNREDCWLWRRFTTGPRAKVSGVGLQVVRDWMLKFNAHGPDGLIDRKAPGRRREPPGSARSRGSPPAPPDARRSTATAALADRSPAKDFRGIPHRRVPADAGPRAAQDGLSQALGFARAITTKPWAQLRILKNHAARLDRASRPPHRPSSVPPPLARWIKTGTCLDCFPDRPAFRAVAAGRHPQLYFRGPAQPSLALGPAGSLNRPKAAFVTASDPAVAQPETTCQLADR